MTVGGCAKACGRQFATIAAVLCLFASPLFAQDDELPPEEFKRATEQLKQGNELLNDWQFGRAAIVAAELLFDYPQSAATRRLAARVLHSRGEYEAALSLINVEPPTTDAAGQGEDHLRELILGPGRYQAYFQRRETEHFSIRYLDKDEVVATYAADVLESAWARIGAALDLHSAFAEDGPRQRIVVEIFPNARGLAGATGLTLNEIETSGTIAVCKFNRLMIISPLATANGYGWANTLAHEFTHLAISTRSHNTIPIWLHEGIAKYYESLWSGEAGENLGAYGEKLLAEAVESDSLITFDEMHPSMAKLPSQDAAALAFAEVFTMVEYLVQQRGQAGIVKVLKSTAAGAPLDVALKSVFGRDLRALEIAWKRYLRGREFRVLPGARPRHVSLRDDEGAAVAAPRAEGDADLTPLEEIDEPEVNKFTRLGELLQLRGKDHAAIIEYRQALDAGGRSYPGLLNRLARAFEKTSQPAEAVKVLEKLLAAHPDDSDGNLMMGRMRVALGERALARQNLESVQLRQPFNPEIHALLAEIYDSDGNQAAAARERDFAALCRQSRPRRRYPELQLVSGSSQAAIIPEDWQEVRLDAGAPLSAPVWGLPLALGKHDVEYRDAAGNYQTVSFVAAKGELVVVRLPRRGRDDEPH